MPILTLFNTRTCIIHPLKVDTQCNFETTTNGYVFKNQRLSVFFNRINPIQ